MQELTKPITGYGSLAKANPDFPTDSEDAKWDDKSLQTDIADEVKANMFFEQREKVRAVRMCDPINKKLCVHASPGTLPRQAEDGCSSTFGNLLLKKHPDF